MLKVLVYIILKFKPNEQFMECLNYQNNLISLLEYETRENEVSCYHGMKVLLCVFVFIGHKLQFVFFGKEKLNSISVGKIDLKGYFIITSLVEPFFVMSGCLLTINMLRDIKR